MNEAGSEEATLFPRTAGERLRDARLALGLDLAEVSSRTRIRERYLQAIEEGDYGAMQSTTYAVGFAKSYARTVGIDEVEIAREVRGQSEMTGRSTPEYQPYEMDDPARLPSRGVTIAAVLLGLLVLVGVGLWYGTTLFRGDGITSAAPVAETGFVPEPDPVASATPDMASGQVTLVATDDVWLRIYDAAGTTLVQKTMLPGERYDVPADANGPMINVGRPDKLQVLVNGSEVAPLGDGKLAIKDVGIGAAALAARNQPAPAPSAAPPADTAVPGAATTAASTGEPRARREVPPYFRQPDRARPTAGRDPSAPVASPPPAESTTPPAAAGNTTTTP